MENCVSYGGKDSRLRRRRFLTRGVELASTIPLVGILAGNFLKSRNYYEANSSEARLEEKTDVIKTFYNMQHSFRNSLVQLFREYDRAYYNSHIEVYTTTDAKGNLTTSTRTVWRWEEPRSVPDHRVIAGWKDYQNQIVNEANFLISSHLVDANKVKDIIIEKKQAGKIGQGVLNVGVYGAEIGLLMGYEEILASVGYSGYGEKRSMAQRVRDMNTDKQISRRSFFKVGAALVGAGVAWKVGRYNKNKLEKGKSNLEGEIKKAWGFGDEPPENSFQRYFGVTPKSLMNNIKESIRVSKSTLNGRVRENGVRSAFGMVVREGEKYFENLEGFFSDGVPRELGYIASCGNVTKKLDQISKDQRMYASSGILLEGLAVGGTLAAILIPAEVINSRFK